MACPKKIEEIEQELELESTDKQALEHNEDNSNTSKAMVVKHLKTKSLKNLEKMLSDDPKYKYRGYIAMYVYYDKYDKISNTIYPNLYREMKRFEEAMNGILGDKMYEDVYEILQFKRDKKQKSKAFMVETAKYVNEIIEKNNISINKLSEISKTKYANLYNFLKKDKYNLISVQNAHSLLWISWSIDKNLTLEEAMQLHKDNFKKIHSYWKK